MLPRIFRAGALALTLSACTHRALSPTDIAVTQSWLHANRDSDDGKTVRAVAEDEAVYKAVIAGQFLYASATLSRCMNRRAVSTSECFHASALYLKIKSVVPSLDAQASVSRRLQNLILIMKAGEDLTPD